MKDGYYLSTYLYINKLSYLTKIQVRHDQNISLWKVEGEKIELVHYWELERITGQKNHRQSFFNTDQARKVINKLLKRYNLALDDIEEVWGTPNIDTGSNYSSLNDYPDYCYHNISHLFSALLLDTTKFYNENILAIAVDGIPDKVLEYHIDNKYYYAGIYSRKGKIEDIFPVYSPGVMWGVAREHYKIQEGSLMALANATSSILKKNIFHNIWINSVDTIPPVIDSLVTLFNFVDNLSKSDEGTFFDKLDPKFSLEENKISMVMKVIQIKSMEIMVKNIEMALKKNKIEPEKTYLALSGGFGLNCPTNTELMHKFNFKGFIAPPCINDSGMSLGIALYSFYKKSNGKQFKFILDSSYFGDNDDSFKEMTDKYKTYISKISRINYEQVVKDIEKHPIVWFEDSAEIGPRALGHRSILGNPKKEETKTILNKIKMRQWWRPVAPIILEEDIDEWFEDAFRSPFMLHTFKIKEDKIDSIPSIPHKDNSARIQTLNKNDNPALYTLLLHFKKKHSVPMLCNTSLNDNNEPIINTIDELCNFILRKKIKVAYINRTRITFHNHELYSVNSPLERKIDFDNYLNDNQKKKWINILNPHKISREKLKILIKNPKLLDNFDLKHTKDINLLDDLYKNRKNLIILNKKIKSIIEARD